MKCVECNLWWADREGEYPRCHADPNWPAPCEYTEEWDEEDEGVVDDGYDPGLEPDWEMLECSDEPSIPEGSFKIGKEYENDED